jgi:hypothetical protein
MIIIEKRLIELFNTLPPIKVNGISYKPIYDFGTQEDLLKFLKYKRKEGTSIYPLIWVETPIFRKGDEKRKEVSLKLVLATLTNSEISNTERLLITFDSTLLPLKENVLQAINQSGFTRNLKEKENNEAFYFNYGVKNTNKKTNIYNYGISDTNREISVVTDIWDAISLELTVEFTECKLKNINFKNN